MNNNKNKKQEIISENAYMYKINILNKQKCKKNWKFKYFMFKFNRYS